MEDTDPEINKIQLEMWLSLSVEERLRRTGKMFSLAKSLVRNSAPKGLTPLEEERYIFKRIHGCYPEEFVERNS